MPPKRRFITCEICKNRASRSNREKRMFMARFPLDEDRCKQWVKFVGKEDLICVPIEKLHTLKYVCGNHFDKRAFNKKQNRLKKWAIPSKNLKADPLPDEMLLEFPCHIYSNVDVTTTNTSQGIIDNEASLFQAGPSTSDSCTGAQQLLADESSDKQKIQSCKRKQSSSSEPSTSRLQLSDHDYCTKKEIVLSPKRKKRSSPGIQVTALTSRDFPGQCLPEYTQCSHDSEVIAYYDIQTLPQVPQNLPTTQKVIASSLCETKQKVLVETIPQVTVNLPANPDSKIQATAFTSRDFPKQCLPDYMQSSHDSEIQATAFTSREFSEQCLPEYTPSSQDSEVIASSLYETKQKVLVETLPQVTQNIPANPDSEIQVFTFTSREFSEQCLPEYTQSSQDSERIEENMINTDDQSIDGRFLFKVSEVEACRICLATNVKLFSLQDTHLGNCMKSIAGFSTSSCGGLPNFVCYQCAPILLKCAKLIEKSKVAEATLLGIVAKNGLITKTLIEQEKILQPDLQSPLDSYLLLNYYYIKYDDDSRTSEYIQAESDPHIEMEIDNSGIENEVGANEMADQDDISVVEIQTEIPMVELDSSDGESNEGYISLVPHKTNEKLEKCAKGISSKFQRKPRWTKQRKRIRLYKLEEFQDIPQHFTTHKIPVIEQKQAWRDNMVMKRIETGKEFICSVCQRTFQTEDALNAHSQNHTNNTGGERCDVCLVGFPDEPTLWYHTERTHAYRFNCKHCPMVLNNIDDAKYHKNFVCNGSGIKRSRRQPKPHQ